jgi:4-hydroxybenzoate polyprenyltransferase
VSRIRTTARLVVLLSRPPVLLLLGLFAVLGMAQAGSHGDWWTTGRLLLAVAGFVVASVAVNDLADEAVDRVNLPGVRSRPLASGAAHRSELALVAGVAAGASLAAAYSLPPLRLSARGAVASLLLPAGYVAVPFLAGAWAVRPTSTLPASDALLLIGLFLGFIGRILLKDFRDVRGDALFGKRTFLVRYGRASTCAWSAAFWVLGSVAVGGVRAGAPVLWVAQAGWVAVALMLLRLLSADGGPRRDERLISGVAITGRGMVATTILWLGVVDRGVPVSLASALVGSFVVVLLGQVWTMVRFGPASRLRVPTSWTAASACVEHGEQRSAVAVESGACSTLPALRDERVLAAGGVGVGVDRRTERRSPLDRGEGRTPMAFVGGEVALELRAIRGQRFAGLADRTPGGGGDADT